MDAIKINHLTKYYNQSRGIEDVSFSVKEGEFFGFIGPNGAGKSTTIRTLLGLINATGGLAEIFGRNVQKEKAAILEEVGYLPSEAMFYQGMRVRDILKLSADLRRKNCQAEAEMLCDRLKLDMSRKVHELSLGNRKKVGIVCAMQHQPKLYILDEPTSGLDPLMQREFFALLQERNEQGATIFLSSHILSEVQRYCKTAAVIREGRILVCDSVDKLGHSGTKRVTLHGAKEALALKQMKDVKKTEDTLSFLYSGKIDVLLKALSEMSMSDITIADPDMEEIFLHYYAKEAGRNGNIDA